MLGGSQANQTQWHFNGPLPILRIRYDQRRIWFAQSLLLRLHNMTYDYMLELVEMELYPDTTVMMHTEVVEIDFKF